MNARKRLILEGSLETLLKVVVPTLHVLAYVVYTVNLLRGKSPAYAKLWFVMLLMAVANVASYVAVASWAVAPQYVAGVVATFIVFTASLVKTDGSHLNYSWSHFHKESPRGVWLSSWIFIALGAIVLAIVMTVTWVVAAWIGPAVQIVLALMLIPMVWKVIVDQFDARKPSEWYSWTL